MGEPLHGSRTEKHRLRCRARRQLPGLALGALLAGAAAAQQEAGCNGRVESAEFPAGTSTAILGGPHTQGETTTFAVQGEGFEHLSIAVQGGATICSGAAACDGASYTATADGDARFAVSGRAGGRTARIRASCSASPAAGDAGAAAAFAPGSGTGMGHAIAAHGDVAATRGGLHFGPRASTGRRRGLVPWAEIAGRRFDGALGGSGIKTTLGADVAVGQRGRVGAVLSYGSFNFSFAGAAVITEAISYGPYAVISLGRNWSLEGYLVYASPAYVVGGSRFTSNRTSAGLKLNAESRFPQVVFVVSAGVRGFAEYLPAVTLGGTATPARTLSSLTALVGATAEFRPGMRVRPYLSLAGEHTWYNDGFGTMTAGFAPRAGGGVRIELGGGEVALHADVGELFKGTSDFGLSLTYHLEF